MLMNGHMHQSKDGLNCTSRHNLPQYAVRTYEAQRFLDQTISAKRLWKLSRNNIAKFLCGNQLHI